MVDDFDSKEGNRRKVGMKRSFKERKTKEKERKGKENE